MASNDFNSIVPTRTNGGNSDIGGSRHGQTGVILTLVVPALIAAIAFGTDLAVLYMNWTRLQVGTDTAVMAGVVYLPGNPAAAIRTAEDYARICGIATDEIVATKIGPDRTTISMTVTRKVTLVTRFLGVGQGNVAANSTATVHSTVRQDSFRGGALQALMPIELPFRG
jgi:Flp pilus assembly protein TadG